MGGPAIGDRMGRYTLEAVLGEGGMGRVYRARDETLHRVVALKVVLDRGNLGTEGIARLLREARAAAAFDHANAVAIHDVGEHEGLPYLAMELVRGRTLRTFIGDRERSPSWKQSRGRREAMRRAPAAWPSSTSNTAGRSASPT